MSEIWRKGVLKNYLLKNLDPNFDGINILDALSASGLRTIRFLKELKDIKKIYANDISETSHVLMKKNFIINNLDVSRIERKEE